MVLRRGKRQESTDILWVALNLSTHKMAVNKNIATFGNSHSSTVIQHDRCTLCNDMEQKHDHLFFLAIFPQKLGDLMGILGFSIPILENGTVASVSCWSWNFLKFICVFNPKWAVKCHKSA